MGEFVGGAAAAEVRRDTAKASETVGLVESMLAIGFIGIARMQSKRVDARAA